MTARGADRWGFISDLQIPFEAENALPFVRAVEKEFKIPRQNWANVGDETDQYFGGRWPKDPDAEHTPLSELAESIERLKEWYAAYPRMLLAESNHAARWANKAVEAQIPSQLMKAYREVIQAPATWKWAPSWVIKMAKADVMMLHGMGYGGMYAHRHAAVDHGMNVVHGHLHSNAGISYIVNEGRRIWGMNVGCLINSERYAFKYGKHIRHKPVLGIGVVVDGGLTPIFVPYERFK